MTTPEPDWGRWYDAHAARLVLYARQWLPERADEGIRFVDELTPARVLRRKVIERHLAGDGAAEVQVPREDVIFLPVALR